jgi:pyruvate dehydrogenase E1 component alpha subunit
MSLKPASKEESLLYQMLRIRMVEEEIAHRYSQQQMRCPTHLCIGQEAIAVGISHYLEQKDKVYSNHRAHGHYLAKGGSLNALIAELYGKPEGCCGGRGGSMHMTDLAAGFVAATPIVGGTVPVAAGNAWSMKLKRQSNVVVLYFGDGCFEEGVVHETLNFAALQGLPLVFVCENNEYAVMTKMDDRQPNRSISAVAEAHGIRTAQGDGNNVLEVAALAERAIGNARKGEGPQFLEFLTHRWPEHCGPNDDDYLGYRQPGELASWKEKCPIKRLKAYLVQSDKPLSDEKFKAYLSQIEQEIKDAFDLAIGADPLVNNIAEFTYA